MGYAPYYTSVEQCYAVVSDLGSVTNLTSAQIVDGFIKPAESIINAIISNIYIVPIVPGPPLLEALATDLTLYRILSQRIFNQQRLKDSVWPLRFKESMDILKQIVDGAITLVDSAGNILPQGNVAVAESTTTRYLPTFHEGPTVDQIQDRDKIRDIEDDRGLISDIDRSPI